MPSSLVEAGPKLVSVHVEADAHLHRTLASIKGSRGAGGVVVNPATPIESFGRSIAVRRLCARDVSKPGFWRTEVHTDLGRQGEAPGRMIEERQLDTRD